MPKRVATFRCIHCNKHYVSLTHCKEHEEKCYADKRNKACRTCDYYDPNPDGRFAPFCDYHQKLLVKISMEYYNEYNCNMETETPFMSNCPNWVETKTGSGRNW